MKTVSALFTGIVCFFFAGVCVAQEEPVKPAESESTETSEAVSAPVAAAQSASSPKSPAHRKEPVVSQGDISELQGEVVHVSDDSISVLVKRDTDQASEEEMMFTFDASKINLERVKSLSAISQGDTVAVRYCMETKDYGDMNKINNKVLTIRYVRPANDQSYYRKKSESEATQLTSSELSLKGEKTNE